MFRSYVLPVVIAGTVAGAASAAVITEVGVGAFSGSELIADFEAGPPFVIESPRNEAGYAFDSAGPGVLIGSSSSNFILYTSDFFSPLDVTMTPGNDATLAGWDAPFSVGSVELFADTGFTTSLGTLNFASSFGFQGVSSDTPFQALRISSTGGSFSIDDFRANQAESAATVPEPATGTALAAALIACVAWRRRTGRSAR